MFKLIALASAAAVTQASRLTAETAVTCDDSW